MKMGLAPNVTQSLDREKIVILAGGLGTRLGSLTKDLPKPMMPVKGRPFLEWQLEYFKAQGFREFLFLTGYLGEMIREHFGDGSKFDLNIEYSQDPIPLGTGGALLNALDLLSDKFLLMFGDSLLPVKGHDVLKGLSASSEIVMTVYDNKEDTDVPFNVRVKEGKVVEYKKGATDRPLTNVEAGVYGVMRKTLERYRESQKNYGPGQQDAAAQIIGTCSFEADILRPSIEACQVGAYLSPERFFDIGTPGRLKLFEERVSDYFPNSV